MAEKILITQIQLRNDTKANWTTQNPTLLKGEVGIEIDTRHFKIGDGVTAWSSLEYANITDLSSYYTDVQVDDIVEGLEEEITALEQKKVDKEDGKDLSTNDFTDEYRAKLDDIEEEAQVNKIEKIQKNGQDLTISNKVVNISVPVALSELTNDAGFIIKTVSDLTNYYAKTQTYSKDEVNSLISNISTFNALIVSDLPTSDISTTTIYLVSKTDTESDDYYDEYLYINNAWEMIGNTKIDLSNYYTKAQTFSKTEVQELIDGLGRQLETATTQVNTNKSNIEVLQEKAHEHSNKDVLDATTEAFTQELKAWYDAVGENNHKHTNMAVLNKITQVYFDWWTEAYNAMHEHSNKDVLDATTASYTTAEKEKLAGIEAGANKTITDSALSATSTNPLQNKVVKAELDKKLNDTDILILDCGDASGN